MGYDYALVHLEYTIPLAVTLTLIYRPLFTALEQTKVRFLILIAVVSTIPWDSYLIRANIWSYPPDAILGPTLFSIPAEELFFFVIQTYITSLVYLCLNKANFAPALLPYEHGPEDNRTRGRWGWQQRHETLVKVIGQLALICAIIAGAALIKSGGAGTYLGLIICWAFPFLLLLWSLSSQFMLRLPAFSIIGPIAIPTFYLWLVDSLALRRGTWVIVQGTKYNVQLFGSLDIEEAVFFTLTNTLVVFGLAAFDHAVAIQHTFPTLSRFHEAPVLIRAIDVLLKPASTYDEDRIIGLSNAIQILQQKSRSFYLASSTFEGALRVDLVLLYAFCRVADDLIDGSTSWDQKQIWIDQLTEFTRRAYSDKSESSTEYVRTTFPQEVQSALLQLPVDRLSKQPLLDLLKGFEMDFQFADSSRNGFDQWPIGTERDLLQYGRYVAGTVAELFLDLVFHHSPESFTSQSQAKLKDAGVAMGQALQIVNIARDVETDAALGRVYIPSDWLKEYNMTPNDVLANHSKDALDEMRTRLLDKAFGLYSKARPSIEGLPKDSRAPMRVAVESYMEIGRVLREQKGFRSQPSKATVNKIRRMWVAWKALTN